VLLCGWLGGFGKGEKGRLLTIEDVGGIMNGMLLFTTGCATTSMSGELLTDHARAVPVNLKDRDAFHLTIEEYLQALISLLDELVRTTQKSHDHRHPRLD